MTVRRSPRGKWMIDIVITHPDRTETRIRRVSPVQTKRGAEAHERKLRQAIEAGTLGKEPKPKTRADAEPNPTPARPPTVAEFVEAFITDHCEVEQHRPGSIRSARSALSNHIVPAVGTVRVDEIRSKHFGQVKRAMARARAEVKPKTINNTLTVLSRMVRFWYEHEGLTPPRFDAGLLRIDEPEAEFYEPAEYEQLVAGSVSAGPIEHALVLIMGDAGLRQGEVRALRWTDIRVGPESTIRVVPGHVDSERSDAFVPDWARSLVLSVRAFSALNVNQNHAGAQSVRGGPRSLLVRGGAHRLVGARTTQTASEHDRDARI